MTIGNRKKPMHTLWLGLLGLLLLGPMGSTYAQIGSKSSSTDLAMVSDSANFPLEAEASQPPLRQLDQAQLKRAKWYYSMDEAMRQREDVYKLSLKGQKLTTFPMDILRFPNLQVLDLSDNKLQQLPEEIHRLQQLEVLNLYHNRLRSLPLGLKELEGLTTIYAGRNRLTEVPVWLGGLSKLRKLDLSYNFLTELELDKVKELLPRCEVTH